MSTYFDSHGNLRPFPWVTEGELGAAREIFFSVPLRPGYHRQYRYRRGNPQTEMFFSVEMKNGERRYGYLTRNDTTDRFTDTLFQEARHNQHIKFIEWSDPALINCVVCDGIYISESHFFMHTDEFAKFMGRLEPPKEV